MEYLQYFINLKFITKLLLICFKPCYKWNTFNTRLKNRESQETIRSFKPCYKWNTFNTMHNLVDFLKKYKF